MLVQQSEEHRTCRCLFRISPFLIMLSLHCIICPFIWRTNCFLSSKSTSRPVLDLGPLHLIVALIAVTTASVGGQVRRDTLHQQEQAGWRAKLSIKRFGFFNTNSLLTSDGCRETKLSPYRCIFDLNVKNYFVCC